MKTKGQLKLAWRIWLPHLETDKAFDRLLGLVKKNRGIIDEVALFDTITHHLYLPLDAYARRTEMMGRRMDAFRRAATLGPREILALEASPPR